MRRLIICGLMALTLAMGCQSENVTSEKTEPAAVTLVEIDPANVEFVDFSVPGMHCEFSCAPKVREVLSAQPGVAEVEVDLPSKTARVKADRTQFDAEAAVAALIDVQFDEPRHITTKEADEARAAAAAEAATPDSTEDAADS